MISNEFNVFLSFVLIGIIISFIFDFFRILRCVYKTPDCVTILEDIAFWLISGIILLLGIFVLNDGNIRAYLFLGLFSGICLYIVFISKNIMKVGTKILNLFNKKLFIPIYRLINSIVQMFFNIIKVLIKLLKKIKNDFFVIKKSKSLKELWKKCRILYMYIFAYIFNKCIGDYIWKNFLILKIYI